MSDKMHLCITICIIIGLLFTIGLSLLTYFQLKTKHDFKLKDSTIEEIKRDTQRIPHFVGIVVISADIQTNTRNIIYNYIADPETDKLISNYFTYRSVSKQEPLFTKDDDRINQRIVRLINHEFDCSPWSALIGSKFVPEASSKIISTCGVAVPPSYGQFNGMVTIFLNKEPTEEEKLLLNTILRDISNDVSLELAKNP